jgi:hypothetical protein
MWQKLKDNIGKIISSIGLGLTSIDLLGVAEPLKSFARDAFGPKGVSIIAFVLFVSLLARTVYFGRKHAELKAACDPANKPPDIP